MQQPPPVMPAGSMPSFSTTNITTEQIQKCLEENKKLILAILENQNLGKLAECAQYQTQLQKNLMYLAAIADAQPQMPAMPTQMAAPPAGMQQGAYYMHPQAASMAQQPPGMFAQKMPMQFANPHQLHEQQMQGQMNIRPGVPSNVMRQMHSDASLGGGGQNNQDAPEAGHNNLVPAGSGSNDRDPS